VLFRSAQSLGLNVLPSEVTPWIRTSWALGMWQARLVAPGKR